MLSRKVYDSLDPGIRETVRWLNDHNFDTTDSGDGTKRDMECAMGVSNVAIRVFYEERLVSEADRLLMLIRQCGIKTYPNMIQASYDPVDKIGIILLMGIDDKALTSSPKYRPVYRRYLKMVYDIYPNAAQEPFNYATRIIYGKLWWGPKVDALIFDSSKLAHGYKRLYPLPLTARRSRRLRVAVFRARVPLLKNRT